MCATCRMVSRGLEHHRSCGETPARNLQLLVASVKNDPSNLFKSMNLCCDSIVVNQCDVLASRLFEWNGHEVRWFDFPERGVGKSRNEALLRADATYVLFCDEDCSYYSDVETIILRGFESNPEADILLFDLKPVGFEKGRAPLRIDSCRRVGRFSYMKYGAAHIAARLSALQKHNISFNLLFGGGAPYSCGEDSVFLKDCLDKGLIIRTCPSTIGSVDFSSSSWFDGFDEKYFLSRGALHRRVAGRWHWVLSLRLYIKFRKLISKSEGESNLRALFEGAADFLRL